MSDDDQAVLVEALVRRYQSFARGSAQNIIELAETVSTAMTDLVGQYRNEFFRQIKLNPESSKVRKLKLIGDHSPRFVPYLEILPSNWTTLYELARLEVEDFKRIVDAGVLTPLATWKEISEPLKADSSEPRSHFPVTFDLESIQVASRRREFLLRFSELAEEFGIEFRTTPPHAEELDRLMRDEAEEYDENAVAA